MTPQKPADVAREVIKGGAQRLQRVYIPYLESRWMPLVYQLIPEYMMALVRYTLKPEK